MNMKEAHETRYASATMSSSIFMCDRRQTQNNRKICAHFSFAHCTTIHSI